MFALICYLRIGLDQLSNIKRAIRFHNGVHRITAIPAVRGEVGWSKTRSDRWLRTIRYWNILVYMSTSRLTHQIFEWDYKLSGGNANWSSEIRAIMNANGFEDKFISKLQYNLEIVKSRIKNKDIESWHSDVRKKTKLRTYVTFKNEFNVESYLLNPIQKCQRSVFAKLRCGILPLHIKTGQYTDTTLENHLCEFCENNVTEDEKHFICSCI